MRVAIMGAGSLGTVLGAYMSKAGVDVTLVDAYKAHVDALNEKGATIIGKVEFSTPVKAVTSENMDGIFDVVFYLVKQTFHETALPQLLPHLGENSVVCVLQNGIPEYTVAKYIGQERIVGGVVGWGATFIGPGVSEVTTVPSGMEFDIGEIDGSITERLKTVQGLLETMCETKIIKNLLGVRWNKLIANAGLSGLCAALGCVYGDVLDNKEILDRMKFLGNECIQVCEASGSHMAVRHGYDHGNLLRFTNRDEMEVKDWLYKKIWEPHRSLKGSQLQDLERGKPTEVDFIGGVVCEVGREHGVPTPVCDDVVSVIHRIQDGELKPCMDNLKYIRLPEID